MGTLTDDQITIGTTALDKDSNSHFAKPEEKITLVDTVEYEGLKKGQSYKLIGTLMDQESGKPIEIDGKPVTAETTFKPKKSSGSAKVTFTFNASSLKGKTIVVFEELYQEMCIRDRSSGHQFPKSWAFYQWRTFYCPSWCNGWR